MNAQTFWNTCCAVAFAASFAGALYSVDGAAAGERESTHFFWHMVFFMATTGLTLLLTI